MLALFVRHALRDPGEALIDLRLFKNRTFAVSSLTLSLVIISVFGGMLLLPLYLQAVRGESAMDTGLLLAPQGFGAMIAMPIAGRLTDRTGVGRIVPVGLVLVAISFLGLTQLASDTSYWTFGVLLFVMGLGMGATMMPTFSGAMQTLRRVQIARASTTLNINQQVSASIGTAVLSVLLANALADRLPGIGGGGIGAAGGGAAGGPRADHRADGRGVRLDVLVGARARRDRVRRLDGAAAEAEARAGRRPRRSRGRRGRTGARGLEAVRRLAVRRLGEGEHLGRLDAEDGGAAVVAADEHVAVDVEVPDAAVLGLVGVGEPLEGVAVGDRGSRAPRRRRRGPLPRCCSRS